MSSDTEHGASAAEADVVVVDAQENQPQKKKQKRNKPTLSCLECVERKTKVRVVESRGITHKGLT
jgi:hypothetical protein